MLVINATIGGAGVGGVGGRDLRSCRFNGKIFPPSEFTGSPDFSRELDAAAGIFFPDGRPLELSWELRGPQLNFSIRPAV